MCFRSVDWYLGERHGHTIKSTERILLVRLNDINAPREWSRLWASSKAPTSAVFSERRAVHQTVEMKSPTAVPRIQQLYRALHERRHLRMVLCADGGPTRRRQVWKPVVRNVLLGDGRLERRLRTHSMRAGCGQVSRPSTRSTARRECMPTISARVGFPVQAPWRMISRTVDRLVW